MLKISVILLLVVVACATAGLFRDFETLDVNDEEVKEVADKAALAINKQFRGQFHHKLVKIVSAKKKDVAGYKTFKMDLVMGMTTCKKQEVTYEEAKQCDVQEGVNQETASQASCLSESCLAVSAYKKCTVSITFDLNGKQQSIGTGCVLGSKSEI